MTSDVGIFWDFENCRPPKHSSGYEVVNNIRDIAHEYGTVKLLKAYVEPDPLTRAHLRSELQLSGVSLTDCPHNGNKEVADKMIIVDAMLWALESGPSATVVIITGDRDFGYAVSMLRLRRYRVVVISQTQLNTPPHPCLTKQASFFYSWEEHVLKVTKPAHPTHSRSKSAPVNVPTIRSDAPPPKPRARSTSVVVTTSVNKPSATKQQATTSGHTLPAAPKSSPSFATLPSQNLVTPPTCEQAKPSTPAGSEPTVAQPPLLTIPSGNLPSSSKLTPVPPLPPQKPLPPVGVEQLNGARSLLGPSLLSPSPMSVRSNISVVHVTGEFCGKSTPSTSIATTLSSPTVVEPLTTIAGSPPVPEHVVNCSGTTGNTLPVVGATLHTVSETDAISPSTPISSVTTSTDSVRMGSDESSTANETSPSSASSCTLGDSPLDDHQVIELSKPTDSSCLLFAEPILKVTPSPIQEMDPPAAPSNPLPIIIPEETPIPYPLPPPVLAPPHVPKPISSDVPAHFFNLIKLLQRYRNSDLYEPLMSKVAAELPDRDRDERASGAIRFGQFCDLAQGYGIIDIGNPGPGREWIRLCPSFYRFSPILVETKRKHPKFAVLAEVLLELHSKGKTKPSRSEVALQIVRRCPRVYKDAGVNKFAQYASKAEHAQVVVLGFPPLGTNGDPWISLHPQYVE